MKLKINRSLNEDTLADVINDFGEQTAKEVKAAAAKLPDRDNLYIESSPDLQKLTGDIEKALNNSYEIAQDIKEQIEIAEEEAAEEGNPAEVDPSRFGFAPNVLITGPAGTGKTARIKAWCKEKGVTLIAKDAKTMDPSDLGGIISRQVDDAGKQLNKATKLTNTEFDQLDTPNTVLFLDELNRAPTDVAGSLLTLIQDHAIPDANSPTGSRILKGFMFTVAAVNPASGEYDVEDLDMAMKTRFGTVSTEYDNLQQLKYLEGKYQKIVNNPKYSKKLRMKNYNKYQIAKALLTSPLFHFDTEPEEEALSGTNYAALNYRSLTNALEASQGDKDKFLEIWNQYCNPNKYEMVEDILSGFVNYDWDDIESDSEFSDIDDKANSVFNGNNPFATDNSWDKISKHLG